MIAIAAGIPAAGRDFGIVSVVVVLSMIVHGASATPVLTWYGRRLQRSDLPEEVAVDAAHSSRRTGSLKTRNTSRGSRSSVWRAMMEATNR